MVVSRSQPKLAQPLGPVISVSEKPTGNAAITLKTTIEVDAIATICITIMATVGALRYYSWLPMKQNVPHRSRYM